MKINKNYKIIVILLVFLITISLGLTLRLQRPSHPNIILITVDALRADHLGCYDYKRNTSPNIDKLAKEGTIFLNCFATGPGTVYSFPGLLTGRYLSVNKGYILLDNLLDKEFSTLAEYLKNAGYYTAAFLNNTNLKINKGFEQGFDYFRNEEMNAERMTTSVSDFLSHSQSNKPFFIWVHYLDAHTPYRVPEKYFKNFENDKLYQENDKILQLYSGDSHNPFVSQGYIPRITFRKNKYSLNYYIACYDASILYTDFYIGKLLENIKGNTLIILTADHGEALGEHNRYFTHEVNIYDELLHIPLIIKDSEYFKGGKKIPTIVSSIDIVPTILSRINPIFYFFNKNRFNGIDLKTVVAGKKIKRRYIYAYYPWAWSIRDVKNNIKYILCQNGREELYFLPDENANHINDDSLEVNYIKKKIEKDLKNWLKRGYPIRCDKNSKRIFLDKQAKEMLKCLGYLQ